MHGGVYLKQVSILAKIHLKTLDLPTDEKPSVLLDISGDYIGKI